MSILTKIFGTSNDRFLKKIKPVVDQINTLETRMMSLTDAELRQKTDEFKERLSNGEIMDNLLPEAFATVREASRRILIAPNPDSPNRTMRHFDVQLIGGIVLHQGKIAEMATGEGKTLVATLPAYLNALAGKGVHIVTVNDYLAKRDRDWMSPLYEFLGLKAGAIQSHQEYGEKKAAYLCDITYGTNNEFGFDYLRDNMRVRSEEQVQISRGLNYAIVDEVDSILIDEARTPLIISGSAEESTEKYYIADKVARRLKFGKHFEIKEKERMSHLTEEGIEEVEKLLNVDSIYTDRNMEWPHYIEQALRAHHLFKNDKDYIVKGGEVVIVDEFTGRLMEGRVWSDGLHQAVQAKEHQRIKEENQTLATITLQNFYRLYKKLAGMTGTAITEAAEFDKIYRLEVISIPTNKPMRRTNFPDRVYRTEKEKFDAIIKEIVEVHKQGRPILVGTVSIEKSELLSEKLMREGIEHEVLNAKQHEREAHIVAKAGQPGNVTIATNMAGRGTDIVLGEGVATMGGLHIIGTERHEARRIDNQLRGRAGRQGDPGSSRFYVSLQDDLMRIFASERVSSLLKTFGMEEGMAIEHTMVSKSIERAQKKVEEHNFEIRKHLLEYDEVMDEQRKAIYTLRQNVLEGKYLRDYVVQMIEDCIREIVNFAYNTKHSSDEEEAFDLAAWFKQKFGVAIDLDEVEEKTRQNIENFLIKKSTETYGTKENTIGKDQMEKIAQILLLEKIDTKWKDHLYAMDHLRSGIGLRGYAQVDPRIEYKREALGMFEGMNLAIRDEVTDLIFRLQLGEEAEKKDIWHPDHYVHQEVSGLNTIQQSPVEVAAGHIENTTPEAPVEQKLEPIKVSVKIGRNQPCPCGSGRKFKQCCGRTM
ncbi:MAG: preprotein translocase subunit SecA [Candidatus Jettenia sp.]|uniref:Protein translocase subunit SecA n=1 Tax=Candidatus Jettenia caeni TaxID=247490 RepID=I3IPP8_9BACT|nr:preprotein translocase subunit SecA [Candidatus Jettenia sp. AMX1]MBC6929167.1 preprotein translocase subunit SecA [Candidatus Jettenia sp.]NUN22698.1 preprotein translocase subunit SecA [Candidatus Jettenia caeni]KAA0250225.1 MAG: preprotein translocase subunit SecA [Candidatus Jettenia sp. AMX1]MCE7880522.1 preprotein translocase subunit SecA [Candidatus Jettenia sp. AMX1]MCQ3927323.1 preprotein translocase subunit SecA [Candidatus Jettenia sp.]